MVILTQGAMTDKHDHEASGVLNDKETNDYSQSFVSRYYPRSSNGSLRNTTQEYSGSMYGSLERTAQEIKIKRGTEVFHTRQMSNSSSSVGDSSFSLPSSTQNNVVYLNSSHQNSYLNDASPSYLNETDSAHSRQQSSCTSGSSSSAVSAPHTNYEHHQNNIQELSHNYQSFELPNANANESVELNPLEDGDVVAASQHEIDYGYSSTSTSSTETSSAPSSGTVLLFFISCTNRECLTFNLFNTRGFAPRRL